MERSRRSVTKVNYNNEQEENDINSGNVNENTRKSSRAKTTVKYNFESDEEVHHIFKSIIINHYI